MISTDKIKELAAKYQTTELNVIREYFQHLFLSYFYQQPISGLIYFKGGTALKIIYKSPRFSEDLDFSIHKIDSHGHSPWSSLSSLRGDETKASPTAKSRGPRLLEIDVGQLEESILKALGQIEKENVEVSLKEAQITSGGYLANIVFKTQGFQAVVIQLEISSRKGDLRGGITTIASDYILPYIINSLAQELLVDEKIQALLHREKPRDFYDLYFILRSNLLSLAKRVVLPQVLKILKDTDINFEKELKVFLPKTHWAIIRDFKQVLEREIQRFV